MPRRRGAGLTGPAALRELGPADVEAALALWRACPGVGLSDADEPARLAGFLARNGGLSFAAVGADGALVGTVLCGTDGRRGYLYHLAVAPTARRRAIGRALAARALEALEARGIDRCHLMVFADNQGAIAFWRRLGWRGRDELVLMSRDVRGA